MGTTLRLAMAPTIPHMGLIVARRREGKNKLSPAWGPGRVEALAACSWPHVARGSAGEEGTREPGAIIRRGPLRRSRMGHSGRAENPAIPLGLSSPVGACCGPCGDRQGQGEEDRRDRQEEASA